MIVLKEFKEKTDVSPKTCRKPHFLMEFHLLILFH